MPFCITNMEDGKLKQETTIKVNRNLFLTNFFIHSSNRFKYKNKRRIKLILYIFTYLRNLTFL